MEYMIKKYRPYNMSIYIVLVYFWKISIGFRCASGLPPSGRAPVCKKPLPVPIFRFVPSTAIENTGWRSIFPAWSLRATCRLPGPRTPSLISQDNFIKVLSTQQPWVYAPGYGVIGIDSSDRRGSLWEGQSSALVCDSIVYGMGSLPKALLGAV